MLKSENEDSGELKKLLRHSKKIEESENIRETKTNCNIQLLLFFNCIIFPLIVAGLVLGILADFGMKLLL